MRSDSEKNNKEQTKVVRSKKKWTVMNLSHTEWKNADHPVDKTTNWCIGGCWFTLAHHQGPQLVKLPFYTINSSLTICHVWNWYQSDLNSIWLSKDGAQLDWSWLSIVRAPKVWFDLNFCDGLLYWPMGPQWIWNVGYLACSLKEMPCRSTRNQVDGRCERVCTSAFFFANYGQIFTF